MPLTPRSGALGIWTGTEGLILGGSDAEPCPAGADCVAPEEPPLRDGAAFDPVARTWRRVAAAPVGFSHAEGAAVGERVYVWNSDGGEGASRAFLAYDLADDAWERLPSPPGSPWRSIAAAGDGVVAYSTSDEAGASADLIFDPATGRWRELPDDPLPRSFDRTMVWSGDELVLFGKRIVPQPGSGTPSVALAAALDPDSGTWRRTPSVALAAALDLDSGTWRRLPDSESLDQWTVVERWFEVDGRVINPSPGTSDGGGDWHRPYPEGGVLDPRSGEWAELPPPPAQVGEWTGQYASGVVGDGEADYVDYRGFILDAVAEEWIEIPPIDRNGTTDDRAVTAVGEEMLVFGGTRYEASSSRGQLLGEAWIWSPRGRVTPTPDAPPSPAPG